MVTYKKPTTGPKDGASRFSILDWAKKGNRTEADAIRTRYAESRAWSAAIQEGLIELNGPDRSVVITPAGRDYMAMLISQA